MVATTWLALNQLYEIAAPGGKVSGHPWYEGRKFLLHFTNITIPTESYPFILNQIDKYSQPKEVGLIKKIAMGPGSQFLLSLTPWYPISTEYRSMNNIQCQYL